MIELRVSELMRLSIRLWVPRTFGLRNVIIIVSFRFRLIRSQIGTTQRQRGFHMDDTMSKDVLTPFSDFLSSMASQSHIISSCSATWQSNWVTEYHWANSNPQVKISLFIPYFDMISKLSYWPMKQRFCHNAHFRLGGLSIQPAANSEDINNGSTCPPFPQSLIQPTWSPELDIRNGRWPMCSSIALNPSLFVRVSIG
jgi:hypothetical protein